MCSAAADFSQFRFPEPPWPASCPLLSCSQRAAVAWPPSKNPVQAVPTEAAATHQGRDRKGQPGRPDRISNDMDHHSLAARLKSLP